MKRRRPAAAILGVTLLWHMLAILAVPAPVTALAGGSVLSAGDEAPDPIWVTTTHGTGELFGTPRGQRIPSPVLRSTRQRAARSCPLTFCGAPRAHRSPYPTRQRLCARHVRPRHGEHPH